MREISAKVYRPGEAEHSGTAWLLTGNFALTALHCVSWRDRLDPDGKPFPYPETAPHYRLVFESGEEAKAIVAQYDVGSDAALMKLLDVTIGIGSRANVDRLPAAAEWARTNVEQRQWWAYGYPQAYSGMALTGLISLPEAPYGEGEVAIQLSCDQGGIAPQALSGMSGAAVFDNNGSVIGMIRSGPPPLQQKVIHATPMHRIEERLSTVREILRQRRHEAFVRAAPNILDGAGSTGAGPAAVAIKSVGGKAKLLAGKFPLFGRDLVALEIRKTLEGGARMLTLTGTNGSGKTRLAIEVGRYFLQRGEVYYVDLAACVDAAGVLREIANTLAVKEAHDNLLEESVAVDIDKRCLLLILDNAGERADANELIGRLLAACDNLRLIGVGSKPLGWPDESTFVVPLLPLPKDTEDISAASVQLFDASAHAAEPGFKLTDANMGYVQTLCNRAGGLPLAIEILAAHTSVMFGQINDVLLPFLIGLGTVETVHPDERLDRIIDCSAAAIDEDTRSLLFRVSVFVVGFMSEAGARVGTVGPGGQHGEAHDQLETLMRKSLLNRYAGAGGEPYYAWQPSVQQYCRRKLEASGEMPLAMRSHANYYALLSEKVDRRMTLLGSVELRPWFELLELEYGNIRAAVAWVLRNSDEAENLDLGLRIVGNLFWFCNLRGSLVEGIRWSEQLLAPGLGRAEYRAATLYCCGGLSFLRGDFRQARQRLMDSVALWQELNNDRRLGLVLAILGMVALQQNQLGEALCHEQRAVSLFERAGDKWGLALALNDLAKVILEKGDPVSAEADYRRSGALWHELENNWGRGLIASNLGNLKCRQKDYDEADKCLVAAMTIQERGRYQWGFAESLKHMGYVKFAQKEYEIAASVFYDSLIYHQRLGRKQLVADCFDGLAEVATELNDVFVAAHLFGMAERVRTETSEDMPPTAKATRDCEFEKARGSALSAAAFNAAVDEGKAMSFAEAARKAEEYARKMTKGASSRAVPPPAGKTGGAVPSPNI